ncbi:hypothetical protein [Halorussus halophilus]|uniref:hypothetical protein n=1 Tax=Halorussus halophilus TaxID=2650975 RepID=UPI0013012673|nr:hypothetical protein [Halorussus halophilus]
MAPVEWLTPDRVMKSWSVTIGLAFLVIGLANLWLGLSYGSDFLLFGVDGFLLSGAFQIVAGAFFLLNEYKFRPEITSGKSE